MPFDNISQLQRRPKALMGLAGPPVAPPQEEAGINESLRFVAPFLSQKRKSLDLGNPLDMSGAQRRNALMASDKLSEFDRLVSEIDAGEKAGKAVPGLGASLRRIRGIDEEMASFGGGRESSPTTDVYMDEVAARDKAERMRLGGSNVLQTEQNPAGADYADSHAMQTLAEQEARQQNLGDQPLPDWLRQALPDTLQAGTRTGPGEAVPPGVANLAGVDIDPSNRLAGMTGRPALGMAPMEMANRGELLGSSQPRPTPEGLPRPEAGTIEDDVRRAALGGTETFPKEQGREMGRGLRAINENVSPASAEARGVGMSHARYLPEMPPVDTNPLNEVAGPRGMNLMQGLAADIGSARSPLPPMPQVSTRPPDEQMMSRESRGMGTDAFQVQELPEGRGFADPGVLGDLSAEALNKLEADEAFMRNQGLSLALNKGFTEASERDLPRFMAGLARSGGSIGGEPFLSTEGGMALMRDPRFQAFGEELSNRGIQFDKEAGQYGDVSIEKALKQEYSDLTREMRDLRGSNKLGVLGEFSPQDPEYDRFSEMESRLGELKEKMISQGIEPPTEDSILGYDKIKATTPSTPGTGADIDLTRGGGLASLGLTGDYGSEQSAEMNTAEDVEGERRNYNPDEQHVLSRMGPEDADAFQRVDAADSGNRAAFEYREAHGFNPPVRTPGRQPEAPRVDVPGELEVAPGARSDPNVPDIMDRAGEWLRPVDDSGANVIQDMKAITDYTNRISNEFMSEAYEQGIYEEPGARVSGDRAEQGRRNMWNAQSMELKNALFGKGGVFEKAKMMEQEMVHTATQAMDAGDRSTAQQAAAQARDSMLQRRELLQALRRDPNPVKDKLNWDAAGESSTHAEKLANPNYRFFAITPAGWAKESAALVEDLHGSDYSASQKAREATARIAGNVPESFSAGRNVEDNQVRNVEIPNPKLESLQEEVDMNKRSADKVLSRPGSKQGLNRLLAEVGLDNYQQTDPPPGGATSAEIEARGSADKAQVGAAEQWRPLAETEEARKAISQADPEYVLDLERDNSEFKKMVETIQNWEDKNAQFIDKPLMISDDNPLGMKTQRSAWAVNDMTLAIQRGQSPSQAFNKWQGDTRKFEREGAKSVPPPEPEGRPERSTQQSLFEGLEEAGNREQDAMAERHRRLNMEVDAAIRKRGDMKADWRRRIGRR